MAPEAVDIVEVDRDTRVTKAPPWHGWVTADLFFSSAAAGTFMVAAILDFVSPAGLGGVARAGFLIAFPAMIADLVCLIFDLGDPKRFHHMLRVFKPSSAMSIGVWSIAAFSMSAFVVFAIAVIDWPSLRALSIAFEVPGLVFAFAV